MYTLFNKQLSIDQIQQMEAFYQKQSKPLRKKKLELAKRCNIDPFVLNKWFQARRNKDKSIRGQSPQIHCDPAQSAGSSKKLK